MDLRRLDAIATAATPSPVEAEVAGWHCKAAPDLPFRRCNVAVPPADAADDRSVFVAGLDQVRRWYHDHGRRLIIQVSSAVPGWEQIDTWLGDARLAVEAPVHLMTTEDFEVCDLCITRAEDRVPVTAGIDAGWADAHGVVLGGSAVDADRARAYGRMLSGLGDRALGASCRIDGGVAGVGFGVLDDGWLGIFGMAVSPDHRRQGIARDILIALEQAARDRGVHQAYLQVETDNAAAIALYERRDFEISHGYHYRSEGSDPDQGC